MDVQLFHMINITDLSPIKKKIFFLLKGHYTKGVFGRVSLGLSYDISTYLCVWKSLSK